MGQDSRLLDRLLGPDVRREKAIRRCWNLDPLSAAGRTSARHVAGRAGAVGWQGLALCEMVSHRTVNDCQRVSLICRVDGLWRNYSQS